MTSSARTLTPQPDGGTRVFRKAVNEEVDYAIDWTELLDAGDSISESLADAPVWTVPTGLTNESTAVANPVTSVTLSGGTTETEYVIRCRITTTPGGRVFERAFTVQVRDPLI